MDRKLRFVTRNGSAERHAKSRRKRVLNNNVVEPLTLGDSSQKRAGTQNEQHVQASNSSTDGDYVMLNEIRKKKLQEKCSNQESLLTKTIDDINELRSQRGSDDSGVSSVTDENHEYSENATGSPHKNKMVDKWWKIFISDIKKNDVNLLVNHIEDAANNNVDLQHIRVERSLMNLLHEAINMGSNEAALVIIARAPKQLLLQTFKVYVKNDPTERNTLQLIAEKGTLALAEAFVDKLDNATINSLMRQETAMEITGQRPRTFPCLHISAVAGRADLVKFFVELGTPVNHLNVKKDTALLWAARWGHIDVLQYLISMKADPNVENDKGSTALYWAVRYNLPEAVKILIEGGANVNQQRKLGFVSPLVLAAALGYVDIVNLLIQNGAKVDMEIRGGETALHQAAREGHANVVESLIKNGATVDEQDEAGDTPLTLAALHNQAHTLNLLLAAGANPLQKNHEENDLWSLILSNENNASLAVVVKQMMQSQIKGDNKLFFKNKPPLCRAAALGASNQIEFLINVGFPTEESDSLGNGIIHHAAMTDNHEIITRFKPYLKIDAQNLHGDTALHFACAGGHSDTIAVLLKEKAKADIQNAKGEIALHVLLTSQYPDIEDVEKLLDYIIKTHSWNALHSQDIHGNDALHIATMYSNPAIIWILRNLTAKQTNDDGNTPFHTSINEDHPELLHAMLDLYETTKREANLNTRNKKGETVLHMTADVADAYSVRRLIHYGCDLAAQDNDGNTILHRLCLKIVKSENPKKYDEIIDIIIANVVKWCCLRDEMILPDDEETYNSLKRFALRYLMFDIKNNLGLTVVNYATQLGCTRLLEKLLKIPDVNYFTTPEGCRIDITNLIPATITQTKANPVKDASCIEILLKTGDIDRAGKTLNIEALHQMEAVYGSLCFWTFFTLMILHLTYMITFTVLSTSVIEQLNNYNTTQRVGSEFYKTELALYVVVSLEPVVMLLTALIFSIKYFVKQCCLRSAKIDHWESKTEMVISPLASNLTIITGVILALLTISWLILYSIRYDRHLYLLAASLWLGWLFSISFTRGFKVVHYFWRMLKIMVVRDVLKFLFIYLFVLLAFSFAMHILFRVARGSAEQYPDPLRTLFMTFNLMLGMVWLFEDGFEDPIREAGHPVFVLKVIVILYLILSTIVLLNVLIAMMNDSYQNIKNTQTIMWRIDSIRLGLTVEYYLPWSKKFFTFAGIRFGEILSHETAKLEENCDNKRWFIDVASQSTEEYNHIRSTDVTEDIKELTGKIDSAEKTLTEAIQYLHDDVMDLQIKLKGVMSNND